jgi:hypothetical protein
MTVRDSFLLLAACAAGYVGGLSSSQTSAKASTPGVVRASRFELVNESGAPVATWEFGTTDGARVRFLQGGTAALDIGVLADGSPRLYMNGRDRKRRIVVGLDQADKPALVMSDEKWEGRVHLGFMPPDAFPYGNWDHWGLLFRAVGSEHAVAGMGMANTRNDPAEPFLRVAGKNIR